MDQSITAEIILFPTRQIAAPSTLALAPTERLSNALTALSVALAEQQQAVQRWREAMTDLANCMRALGGDLSATKIAEHSV
jgi:hypothetical protein